MAALPEREVLEQGKPAGNALAILVPHADEARERAVFAAAFRLALLAPPVPPGVDIFPGDIGAPPLPHDINTSLLGRPQKVRGGWRIGSRGMPTAHGKQGQCALGSLAAPGARACLKGSRGDDGAEDMAAVRRRRAGVKGGEMGGAVPTRQA